jgi:hypothetical protein
MIASSREAARIDVEIGVGDGFRTRQSGFVQLTTACGLWAQAVEGPSLATLHRVHSRARESPRIHPVRGDIAETAQSEVFVTRVTRSDVRLVRGA